MASFRIKGHKLYAWLSSLCICALLFSSCEKTVYIDTGDFTRRMVVNSLIGNDSLSSALISLSQNPLSERDTFERVSNATVQLFKGDTHIADFTNAGSGNYTITSNLVNASAGDEFKLVIQAPDLEEVTAQTIIPDSIAIESVELVDTTYIQVSYFVYDSILHTFITYDTLVPNYQFQLTFNDPSVSNYYSLEMSYEDESTTSAVCFSTDDPIFSLTDEFSINGSGDNNFVTLCDEVFFTDITFNGTQKVMNFYVPYFNAAVLTDPKLIFRLKSLSPGYYKYIETANLQSGNYDDPFAQPVIVYTNITNGFGLFAGYSVSVFKLEL